MDIFIFEEYFNVKCHTDPRCIYISPDANINLVTLIRFIDVLGKM